MVWDSTRERLWLFGGNASEESTAYAPLDDLWDFDPTTSTWTEHTTTGELPAPRLQHGMLYDPERDRLVVYGGSDESAFGPSAVYSRPLWALDLETFSWILIDPGDIGPGGRFWVSLAYDTKEDGYLLFGGHDDGDLGNRNDMWRFDPNGSAWQELSTGDVFNRPVVEFCSPQYDFATVDVSSPERRSDHTLVYSETCGRALVFAGKTDCGAIDDLWAFEDRSWTALVPATEGEVCWRADGDPSGCLTLCVR
jgi:hypothetical protein